MPILAIMHRIMARTADAWCRVISGQLPQSPFSFA
jgi:hypothetical protein